MTDIDSRQSDQNRPKVSRRRATVANLVYQYVAVGFTIINGIFLVPLYLAHIDLKLYGAWLATGNIATWLTLVDPGFTDILRQRTASFFGRGETAQLGGVIGTGFVIIGLLGLLPIVVGVVAAPLLPGLFGLEDTMAADLSRSFLLAAVMNSLVLIAGAAGAVQQGFQRNITFTVIYIIGSVTGIAATIYMLLSGRGLIAIPAGLTLRTGIWLILNWSDVLYYAVRKIGLRLRFCREQFKEAAHLTSWTFLSRLGYQIFGQCDALVVGLLMGPEATPIVVLTRRAWDLMILFLHRISVAFMPGMAHLHGQGDQRQFAQIARRMIRVVGYLLIIGVSCGIALNRSFVALWVGPQMYAGFGYDLLMAAAVIMMIFVLSSKQILFAANVIKGPAAAGCALFALRAAILVGCVWLFGYIGVPLSLLVGYGAGVLLYFGRKWMVELELSGDQIKTDLLAFVRPLAAAVALAVAVSVYADLQSWLGFAAVAVLLTVACGTFLMILNTECRRELSTLAEKLKTRLRRVA